MSGRLFVLLALLLLALTIATGQSWTPPRTPDGHPDLQGIWTSPTLTPFERPAEFKDKAFLTKEEAAKWEAKAARSDGPPAPGDPGNYNALWFDSGTSVVKTMRTSLVVDPPDGKVPLKPEAEARRDFSLAHNADSWEYMSVWDRCITRGVPGGMFPAGYNNAYQIIQTPGYVTIFAEMIHDARVIPVDGRPHAPSSVRFWNGDSVGHWEGNTLVVDTTNFNGRSWVATSGATGRIRGIPQSADAHVVERFTREDANTITYEVTIEDPMYFTKPWTVSLPMIGDPSYRIFEYACHEGNHAVPNVLSGGRAHDRVLGVEMKFVKAGIATIILAAAIPLLMYTPAPSQTPGAAMPRTADGKPDLNGIWQAFNEANWDIEAHSAGPSPVLIDGAIGATPPGIGIVEGGSIPYKESALEQKKENYKNRISLDPEVKCYLPGVPRATYMPQPFQILQTTKDMIMAYQYAGAVRTIYMTNPGPAPSDSWMGMSVGRWEGNTLVVDVTNQNDQTWFDRAGNYHSDALHVVERYTPMGADHLLYEATIEDPNVFTRPWKISMPLYRRVEKNARLMEFKCVEFVEELMYGPLRKQSAR